MFEVSVAIARGSPALMHAGSPLQDCSTREHTLDRFQFTELADKLVALSIDA